MRLPWEQIAMEVIEVSAPELAAKLDISEAEAGWGIILAIKWALARCPDHEPPSANAIVKGPSAARQIARAAGYKGDPELYVKTAASLTFPTLELVPDGIRVRGLNRYDAAWGSNHKALWAAWKAARPDEYPPEPPGTSRGTPEEIRRPDPDPDADPNADAAGTPPYPPLSQEGGAKKTRRRRRDRDAHLVAVPARPPLEWDRTTPAGQVWDARLTDLRRRGAAYAVSQLERLKPELVDGKLVVYASDGFFGEWVEEHYLKLLNDANTGPPIALEYPPKPKSEGATA